MGKQDSYPSVGVKYPFRVCLYIIVFYIQLFYSQPVGFASLHIILGVSCFVLLRCLFRVAILVLVTCLWWTSVVLSYSLLGWWKQRDHISILTYYFYFWMGHTSAGCGINGTDPVRCVSSLDTPRASKCRPPQALTLLGGFRLIAWYMRHRRGPRYFEECQALLSYLPAPRPTFKRPCITLARLVMSSTNTVDVKNWKPF